MHDGHHVKLGGGARIDDPVRGFMDFLQRGLGIFMHGVSLGGRQRGALDPLDYPKNHAGGVEF